MSTPTAPNTPRRTLQRNRRRRKLGGVCAGIADFLGINLTLVRFLFVILIPLTGSLIFWAYLALWFLLPAEAETPMPEVSWALGRELRRIDKRIDKLHSGHDPAVADLAQQAFDALKLIVVRFEQPGDAPLSDAVKEAALVRFPKLLDRLVATPARAFAGGGSGQTAAQTLLNQLIDLHEQFQAAAKEQTEREFRASFRERSEDSPELAAWREKLDPMRNRLQDRVGPQTLSVLSGIEEKLAFLLERLAQGGSELFDLRPFEVRKIAFNYLPDTLDQYLALPPSMARTQRLNSGKTAEEALNEQLGLLDNTLHDLAKSLFEKDAGGLLVHGRFLKEKFAEQPFRLQD